MHSENWFEELNAFVSNFIAQNNLQNTSAPAVALTGDAGFRNYFRYATTPSLIAVFAPPATEKNVQFCEIDAFLCAHGVRAPKILDKDLSKGFFILEDFGDQLLLDTLDENSVDAHYSKTFRELLKLQKAQGTSAMFPAYDEPLLTEEMHLFDEWYVTRLLGLDLNDSQRRIIGAAKKLLVESAISQPQVVVHRDFHARNLMILDDGDIGVIDFQDAVIGPVTYDLVSLLKDCYVRWNRQRVEGWALSYAADLQREGLLPRVEEVAFLRWFHLMGLQRHLKVLGIFARLSLRDKKDRYLEDLPRVMAYTLEVTAMYPELADFDSYLREQVVPAGSSKGWI